MYRRHDADELTRLEIIIMNAFLIFKANQYLRVTGSTMNTEEAEAWLVSQIANKTDLLKGWIREAIAAGV